MLSRLIKSSSTRLVSEFGSSGAMKIPESDKYPGGDVFNGTVSAIVRMVGRLIVFVGVVGLYVASFFSSSSVFLLSSKAEPKMHICLDGRSAVSVSHVLGLIPASVGL